MTKVPILWCMMSNMANLVPQENAVARDIPVDMAAVSELITCLQLLEVVAPYVHESLQGQLLTLLPPLTSLLRHPVKAVSFPNEFRHSLSFHLLMYNEDHIDC